VSDDWDRPLAAVFDYAEFLHLFKHTAKEPWSRILRRDPCSYCGTYAMPTIEHVTPGRGKSNSVENRVAACHTCNHARGATKLLWYLLERRRGVPMVKRQRAGAYLRVPSALTASIGEQIALKRGPV
jgi:hypothetical protein